LRFRQNEMPPGANLASPAYTYDEAQLLIDRTAWDSEPGRYLKEHRIFDTILDEIRTAETYVIADFFLWNPWKGAIEAGDGLRSLANELATALIEKRLQNPDLPMLVITDPINRIYGDHAPGFYQRLADAGIPVVFTALDQLPDSNKLYAPQAWFWSRFLPAEKTDDSRLIPNPFNPEGDKLTLAQLGRLLYFKANHRKLLITGRSGGETRLLVPSFNPADGSANHSNMAVLVDGPVARFAAESELNIARWSTSEPGNIQGGLALKAAKTINDIQNYLLALPEPKFADPGEPSVAYRSEGAIRHEILLQFKKAVTGTRIDIGMFYFSDRKVVEALKAAIERGAVARLLLDANRDAFGREKNGIPNRQVAWELHRHGVEVRWCNTRGEQCHSKLMMLTRQHGPSLLLAGSANYTRRNLDNFNLETNVQIRAPLHARIMQEANAFIDERWGNQRNRIHSLPYQSYADASILRYWQYRLMEATGLSTF